MSPPRSYSRPLPRPRGVPRPGGGIAGDVGRAHQRSSFQLAGAGLVGVVRYDSRQRVGCGVSVLAVAPVAVRSRPAGDAETRGAALQRLVRGSSIPGDDLEVRVLNGWVTLSGDVDVQLQSDNAFDHVAGLPGVTGITDEIEVSRPRRTRDRLTANGASGFPFVSPKPTVTPLARPATLGCCHRGDV